MTRMEEVRDVQHEKSEEQRKQQEEEEFGERTTARRHVLRQASEQERIELEMTHLPLRSWCRHCITGRDERRTVAKQLKKRDKSQVFMGDGKEGKCWRFEWPDHERRQLCPAQWFRGNRLETGFLKG